MAHDHEHDHGKGAGEAAAPNTIYRDAAVGAQTQVQGHGASVDGHSPVDAALAQRGSGDAHESGATFHNDAVAHNASAALGARAFTAGSDVFFGAGQYRPGTAAGDKLIKHELAHVKQARGVAAPKPGNYQVSSPHDAAETAASAHAEGEHTGDAPAAASTIFRDPLPGAPAPAPGVTPPPGAPPPAPATTDPYEEFKRAVAASDAALAKTKWGAVTNKRQLGSDTRQFQTDVLTLLHEEAAPLIRDGGILLANHTARIFADDHFDQWLAALRSNHLLTTFLGIQPKKGAVTSEQARKLTGWVNAATSASEAQSIFEKVYPRLNATGLTGETVAPWTQATIARLYRILAQQLPVGHVQTVTGGFTLMRSHTEDGKVVATGFAWWNPDIFRVVLNESSSGADEGHAWHGMSGGSSSGATGAYTLPDGSAGTQTSQTHFQGSALHEVGHGVGERMGGDAYAENAGNFPGWTNVGRSAWIAAMWTGSAAPLGTQPAGHNDAKLTPGDAKDFMATEIERGKDQYHAGWFNDAPRNDIARYVKWKYGNEPLGKHWDEVVNVRTLTPDGAYQAADPARTRGDWTYGYLTRFHGTPWAKLKTVAYNQKVSWYGISSPKEWFAEQYSHYYRTQKTGGGLIDPATKALLDDLDRKEFVPTNDSGTRGNIVSHSGGATPSPVAAATPGGAPRREPAMFPW